MFVGFLFVFFAVLCGMWTLVPQLGIKPAHSVVEAQILNPWTAREIPQLLFLSTSQACPNFSTFPSVYSCVLPKESPGYEHSDFQKRN